MGPGQVQQTDGHLASAVVFFFFFSWWTPADNKSLSPALKRAGIWIGRLAFSWRMTRMKFLIWAHRRAWSLLRQFISQRSDGQAGSPARLGPAHLWHWSPVPRRDGSPASWLVTSLWSRQKAGKISSSCRQLPKTRARCRPGCFLTWGPWDACHRPWGRAQGKMPYYSC